MQIWNRLYIKKWNPLIIVLIWLLFPLNNFSQNKIIPDSAQANPSNVTDSVQVKPEKKKNSGMIDAEVQYSAKDSIVFLGNGTGFLHGSCDINYKDINLKSDFVRVSMDSSLIFARGVPDSIGKMTGEPIFSEGGKSYNSKELTYNLKTKKGYIRQAITQEGEGYIISGKTKKTSNDVFCIANAKYTTCDRHDDPDFYLKLWKAKVKPGSYIVSGPAELVVEDVPLPIAIPFGFFPFTTKYSSGILMPNYVDELSRGFGLTNGGYYFAINDYVDLEVRGDVYTKGTWALRANSTYVKRYKFRGSVGIEYREDVTGERGEKNSTVAKSFKITWSHSQDRKANPNFNFSSSVNFATSGFNKSNINYYARPDINSQNTTYSSINFTKRFPNLPSLSISGGMSATQRTSDSTVSLSLPSLNISYSRFYPFKRKKAVGKERWYEKIAMSYSGTMANRITTKENKVFSSNLQRDWTNGMKHSIPVSANFNILKYINVSPTFNYTERWYFHSINRSWDSKDNKEVTDTVYKFNRVYDFNMGIAASTKLYGYYIPIRAIFGDKVDRIRHVMTPSIGFSYRPDFGDPKWGYYGTYQKDLDGEVTNVKYSHYAGSMYGTPGQGKSGNINFSLGNNVEMKVRNDNDSTGKNPFKKVSLIDNLSISGSYNLAADSMNWSNFSTNLRLKLTKSYSLNLSTSFDPYMYGLNKYGNPVRINELRWNHGKLPHFTGTSTSYSYTINNDTFKKLFGKKSGSGGTGGPGSSGSTDDQSHFNDNGSSSGSDNQNSSDDKKTTVKVDADGYEKVIIPWSISASYTVSYRNTSTFDYTKMEYKMGFTQNLSLSGNIALTKNWKISANSTYDFKYKQFTYTNVTVNRNLHCWSMSASIVPFGAYKSYSFHIGVNASMLSDLKYDKQSDPRSSVTWY